MRNFAAELKRKCLRLVDSPDQTVFDRHRVSNSQIVGCPLWLNTGLWRSLQVDMEAAHFYNNNIVLSWQPRTTCKFANMRKCVFLALLFAAFNSASAQEVTAPEPEFINTYCILTSDATYATLPKESGTIGMHENKARKWGKILAGASTIAGAGGIIGAATAGSATGVINGVRVATTAGGVASTAGTVSRLAGSSGMDVVFKGGHSSYTVPAGQDVRLLIKGEKNDTDPMDTYRIVKFKTSKKERRIQWIEFESSLIGTKETKNAGYVPFEGHKYGEQSYILTIPASELEKGEYGIFFMNIITATSIPVGTFSIQ